MCADPPILRYMFICAYEHWSPYVITRDIFCFVWSIGIIVWAFGRVGIDVTMLRCNGVCAGDCWEDDIMAGYTWVSGGVGNKLWAGGVYTKL